MDDFIALRCPSCGGNIQVERTLEKMFCTHCGTQLLLKQGADGLLTPMMARDLKASAQLKESQNAMLVIELLRNQIRELEAQAKMVQDNFWEYVLDHVSTSVTRLIDRYAQQVTGKKQLARSLGRSRVEDGKGAFHIDREKMAHGVVGLSTLEDLTRLYQFITMPQNYDQTAYEMAQVLYPLVKIMPDLQDKQRKLKKLMDEIIG